MIFLNGSILLRARRSVGLPRLGEKWTDGIGDLPLPGLVRMESIGQVILADHVEQGWKPVVWFVKGKYQNRFIIQDGVSPAKAEKKYHEWGQPEDSAVYWLHEMLQHLEDSITFDPFAGGGTVPAVCKMLGRRYIALEIDPDTAERARERVRNTQPPLFVLQPEQSEMELV